MLTKRSVIVSNYNSSGWTFTTIFEPMYGQHPVSGNRDFGFTKKSNGSYTFFTKGVDRLTSLDLTIIQNATGPPFSKADALWTSFQKGVADFVNKMEEMQVLRIRRFIDQTGVL